MWVLASEAGNMLDRFRVLVVSGLALEEPCLTLGLPQYSLGCLMLVSLRKEDAAQLGGFVNHCAKRSIAFDKAGGGVVLLWDGTGWYVTQEFNSPGNCLKY
jgi:hypothetical protein